MFLQQKIYPSVEKILVKFLKEMLEKKGLAKAGMELGFLQKGEGVCGFKKIYSIHYCTNCVKN